MECLAVLSADIFTVGRWLRTHSLSPCSHLPPSSKLKTEYAQMVLVHVERGGYSYPALFVLTTNWIPATYEAMFSYIEHVCNLSPARFMMDYERAMRQAIWEVYEGCTIHGCLFNFCQALRRNARAKMPGFSMSGRCCRCAWFYSYQLIKSSRDFSWWRQIPGCFYRWSLLSWVILRSIESAAIDKVRRQSRTSDQKPGRFKYWNG